jgi:uncharacterized protein (DUF1697 family)
MNHIYLALLRGINVGGNNVIRMSDLKATFEQCHFTNIQTYIQSGNVIFESQDADADLVTERLERTLAERFCYDARIVLLTAGELLEVIASAPTGFGEDTASYRYDVWFLKQPLTAREVLESIRIKEGVDQLYSGKQVVYAARLISQITKSRLTQVIMTPLYKNITIRNWHTARRLAELVGK